MNSLHFEVQYVVCHAKSALCLTSSSSRCSALGSAVYAAYYTIVFAEAIVRRATSTSCQKLGCSVFGAIGRYMEMPPTGDRCGVIFHVFAIAQR